jgi:PAS domain S-box-containing protein
VPTQAEASPFPIVAIGVSTSESEAVRALLAKLSSDSGMAFVLIQHLDPARRSAPASLPSKTTSLPVFEISKRIAVQPNHAYMVPYNKRASIREGILSFRPITSRDRKHPVDDFMASLSAELGEDAVGVVLSGTGSDGTRGLAAIKAADGFTFAQDPRTAEGRAMPVSAIEAGGVDFVLAPGRIGLELGHLGRHFYRPLKQQLATQDFDEIFTILHAATGIDVNQYKPAAVIRRILRKMALGRVRTPAQYLKLLRRNPKERESLADHIFLPSTGFFHDAEALEALRKQIQRHLPRKPHAQPLRVWVAGCSTGEEVYTIAMLLVDAIGTMVDPMRILVLGTDIRERNIQHARAGVYSQAAVAGVTTARLKRFFTKAGGSYRIKEELRRLCLFSPHDLTQDPPFTDLDVIHCRHVLPHLRSEFQDQALAAFRVALRQHALLSVDSSMGFKAARFFSSKDSRNGIFSRSPEAAEPARRNPRVKTTRQKVMGPRIVEVGGAGIAADPGAVLKAVDIPLLVLDSRLRIVHFTPESAALFRLTSSDEGASFLHAAANLGELPWTKLLADVTRRGQIVEHPFQHQDGRWYSLRMKPFGEMKHAIRGALIVLLDQDAVRRSLIDTKGLLAESESTVRMLLDVSPEGILAMDTGGDILWANDTTAAMFGYTPGDLLGKPISILVPRPLRNRCEDYRKAFFAGGKSRAKRAVLEFQGLRKDGTVFPVEISLGITKARTGIAGVAFIADITARQTLTQGIRQRENELIALFDSSPDTHVRFDSNLRITHANAAFGKVAETTGRAVVGKMCRDSPLPKPNVRIAERSIRGVFRTGEPRKFEFSIPSAKGGAEYEVRFVPEFSPEGSVAAVLAIGRDITAQKRLQQLAVANQYEIRALTAGLIVAEEEERRRVARDIHDSLSQHLSLLAAEIGSLALHLPASSPAKEGFQAARAHVLQIAQEARAIARQLHPAILEDLGLAKALQSLCDDFSQQHGIPVAFRVHGDPSFPFPIKTASCVYRVAQEALNNVARHARAKYVSVLLSGQRNIGLSIRDNGIGFDPIAVQGGGGLGLISMEERARMAGGSLRVESRPGHGVRVRLTIPRLRETS